MILCIAWKQKKYNWACVPLLVNSPSEYKRIYMQATKHSNAQTLYIIPDMQFSYK